MSADTPFHAAIWKLLVEIFDGPPSGEAYILNPGDPGLLRQLDTISAEAASQRPMPGQTTIAAHVDHLNYGLSLINRWAQGENNPWADADWSASWRRTTVTEEHWRQLREQLRFAATAWQQACRERSEWDAVSASGAISTIAHTAYHLGAMRQLLAADKQWQG